MLSKCLRGQIGSTIAAGSVNGIRRRWFVHVHHLHSLNQLLGNSIQFWMTENNKTLSHQFEGCFDIPKKVSHILPAGMYSLFRMRCQRTFHFVETIYQCDVRIMLVYGRIQVSLLRKYTYNIMATGIRIPDQFCSDLLAADERPNVYLGDCCTVQNSRLHFFHYLNSDCNTYVEQLSRSLELAGILAKGLYKHRKSH